MATETAAKRSRIRIPIADSDVDITKVLGLPAPPQKWLHQSGVTAYERCKMYGLLANRVGLRTKSRRRALDIGSVAHAVIAEMLLTTPARIKSIRAGMAGAKGKKWAKTATNFEIRVERAENLARAMLAKLFLDSAAQNPDDKWKMERTHDVNMGLACGIGLYKKLHKLVVEDGFKVLAVEVPFRTRMSIDVAGGSYDINMAGQIDIVLIDKAGNVWLWDTKTSAASPKRIAARFSYGLQPWVYWMAGRFDPAIAKRLGVKPEQVKGFVHGIIQKPTIRRKGMHKPVAQQQTASDYFAECEEWWMGTGRHEKREGKVKEAPPMYVLRSVMPPSIPKQVARRLVAGNRLNMALPVLSDFPQNDKACQVGNMVCEFAPLCETPWKSWARVAGDQYTTAADPLDADETRRDV